MPESENPQPSDGVRIIFRTVLRYDTNEQFQKCLKEEGLDTLAYIQKCINKVMKENLRENKEHGSNIEKYKKYRKGF